MVRIHSRLVVLEKIRMLGDERDDIVHTLLGRLETPFAVGSYNELVTLDAPSFIVKSYIRRIAQAITSVEVIACVLQHVLDVKTCLEIIV